MKKALPIVGAPLVPIPGEPMGAFLNHHFVKFATKWPRKDLDRLAISFSTNNWPMVGNPELLTALLRAAAFPDRLQAATEETRLLIVCLNRAPDFVIGLLAYLRKQLQKCSPHKRQILFSVDQTAVGPKALVQTMGEQSAVKQDRHRLRKIVTQASALKGEAKELQEAEWRARMEARFPNSTSTVILPRIGNKKTSKK